MYEDFDRCLRGVQSKDSRFDGWFVTGVLTTRIYCRPSCPGRPPYARNIRFFPTAAAAQRAGLRACKRCRPDAAPGSPEWDLRQDTVARAMRLIADGCVDRDGISGLARRLGYSTRHLERLLIAEVGAGPLALARAQRAQMARTLIETTSLPFAEVAFGAGYTSVRQFNDSVRQVFDMTPTQLRLRAQKSTAPTSGPRELTFRLPFRTPMAAVPLFEHFAAQAVPACEEVRDGSFRKAIRLSRGTTMLTLRLTPDHLSCSLTVDDVRDIPAAVTRSRRLFDLDADPEAVIAQLGIDRALGPIVRQIGGVRIGRTLDEHEEAVRVVLAQRRSVQATRESIARLVSALGEPLGAPAGTVTHLFPSLDDLAHADLARFAGSRLRQSALTRLVNAMATGAVLLDPGADRARARQELRQAVGLDDWAVETIAMRAMGDPDAFPATDPTLRRAAAAVGLPDDPTALAAHADRWRPWRSYAVHYLLAAPRSLPMKAAVRGALKDRPRVRR